MKSFYYRTISRSQAFISKHHGWLAAALLILMAGLGLGSMLGNSAVVDEVAHIPAAYSYLHYSDYRLNPEHPPLIKNLAALPLQFLNLKFPTYLPAWTTDVNGQWEMGWNFLYHIGNNADLILFWARLPILLLAVGFGVTLYIIIFRRWGAPTALLTLLFYALSPNILGHAGLVTTDVGASIFIFLAIVAFARFIDRPVAGNFIILTLALAAAQLSKFSGVLLYPYLGLAVLVLIRVLDKPVQRSERWRIYGGGFIGASAASLAVVWGYYATQVANMPLSVQDALIRGSFTYDKTRFIGEILTGFNHLPLMKPLVQYMAGVGMVFGRVTGGNVTYFNGIAQSGSFKGYFPEIFLLKTQIGLLVLGAGLVVYVVWRARNTRASRWTGLLADNIRRRVLEWTLGAFAVFYFAVAMVGNLNLGIRHIMPIYLPIFVIVAVGMVTVSRRMARSRWKLPLQLGAAAMVIWYGISTILAYPNYISYFNELIGGPQNADKYFSDSSVDWGQDLKRFKAYVTQHPEIKHIALDYFGGGLPAYYFCDRRYDAQGNLIATAEGYDCSHSVYQDWHAQNGPYQGQYIAVSETYLENDLYYAAYYHQPGYGYLRERKPIAKVGNSIYVYKLY